MAGQETYLKRLARERWLLRYAKFRSAYDQAARRCGQPMQDISQRQFERWLDGRLKGLPRPAACEVLEEMFGHDAEQLFSRVSIGGEPLADWAARDDAGAAGQSEAAGAVSPSFGFRPAAGALVVPPADTGRPGPADSSPVQGTAGGWAAEREQWASPGSPGEHMIAAMAEESQDLGEWIASSDVADATIEQYAEHVRRLARVFESAMSVPLLLEVRRLRDRIARRLQDHVWLDQARDLYLIAAQVCGLLAWMSGDAGDYRAADKHAWAAWTCAGQAGHDGARAWVRATQAKLAYWDGCFTDSARLAADGLAYASPDSAPVFLALFQARALARTGQHREAARVLGQAADKRETVTAPDLLGGVWELTPSRYHGLRASIRLWMDAPGDAITEAAQAITLSQAIPPGERHLYPELSVRIDQAQAYLQRLELDEAAGTLRPVLNLAADMRIEPLVQQLGRLRACLALPGFAGAPLARSLHDEIHTYQREAVLSPPAT